MFQTQQNLISNKYPAWKYLLLIVVILIGITYALPNLFGEDPSVQISPAKSVTFGLETQGEVASALELANIPVKSSVFENGRFLIRFEGTEDQLKAKSVLTKLLGRTAVVALNLAPATPDILRSLGAAPMYLGLDLRGGIHFLMDVDMEVAVSKAYLRYVDEIKSVLRVNKVRYLTVEMEGETLAVKFKDLSTMQSGLAVLEEKYSDRFSLKPVEETASPQVQLRFSDQTIAETQKFALQQNITTLRNRVNELAVAEPVIQQQGDRRIVVQLPGIQDTARAKEILGATATLEFRMVEERGDAYRADKTGYAPHGSIVYRFRDGRPILLKRGTIVDGENVVSASSGLDPEQGSAMVNVSLDGVGGRKMLANTKQNVGNRMAVVFIERRVEMVMENGVKVKKRIITKDVINAAVIRGQFGDRFQITGLDSPQEAQDLALLLRAGALAAPMEIVEERTVGPSLGQDNINQGFMSVIVGFILV
ncbi:MAG: protein translocase subunit SecD, partial [Thiomicrorhabdus sp.]|nr:protein translocase subunit SecD [Thiomicrorhabdus sp.]